MEIKTIQGYWNHNFVTNQYSYALNGEIIIEDDGWFVGYIKQMNFGKQDNEIGFAFGICENNQVLELFYCLDDFIYRFQICQKEECLGHYSSIGPVIEQLLGQCSITLRNKLDPQMREVDVKTKLSFNFISSRNKEFYYKLCNRRSELIKVVKEKSQDSSYVLLYQLLERGNSPEQGENYQKTL